MSLFKKAVKSESKLRLAIAGPSGSGKTFSGLAIATGLAQGGPIAVIDTEHGSASKYADMFDFDVAEMTAPYHPDKYVRAIKEAQEAGYKVLILDSLTHAWNGEGGLLTIVEEIAARMKTSNTYAAWKDATPIQNRLVEAMLSADMHIIATMRSKQEYVLEQVERGGRTISVPKKVGMAPVQRDGMEYEMDIFLDMDIDNNAIVQKTRCPAISGKVFNKPNGELSKLLLEWLGSGTAQTVVDEHSREERIDAKKEASNVETKPLPAPVVEWMNATNAAESAKKWAVDTGAQPNIHAARNSLGKIVKEQFGGKFTQENMVIVLTAFHDRQLEHVESQADAVEVETAEPVAA